MTAVERRELFGELKLRVRDTCRLGDPVPAVAPEVALLVVDLVVALEDAIAELEELEASP